MRNIDDVQIENVSTCIQNYNHVNIEEIKCSFNHHADYT